MIFCSDRRQDRRKTRLQNMPCRNTHLRNRHHRAIAYLVPVFLAAVIQLGCGEVPEIAELTINGHTLEVEIARSAEEQAEGLMHRKSLAGYTGMLFPYDHDRKLSFWMKNTSIPLSIAFVAADGTIKEIYDMKPFSLKLISSRHSVRYALEVNQGFFEETGISEGDRVEFPEGL